LRRLTKNHTIKITTATATPGTITHHLWVETPVRSGVVEDTTGVSAGGGVIVNVGTGAGVVAGVCERVGVGIDVGEGAGVGVGVNVNVAVGVVVGVNADVGVFVGVGVGLTVPIRTNKVKCDNEADTVLACVSTVLCSACHSDPFQ
jgi:hypothetical protein